MGSCRIQISCTKDLASTIKGHTYHVFDLSKYGCLKNEAYSDKSEDSFLGDLRN